MVDSYSIASVILRIIASVFLMMVFRRQIAEWKHNGGALKRFKILLMIAVLVLFTANLASIGVNFFRGDDGNLIDDVRRINQIFNGVASLLVSGTMYLIYNYHEDR